MVRENRGVPVSQFLHYPGKFDDIRIFPLVGSLKNLPSFIPLPVFLYFLSFNHVDIVEIGVIRSIERIGSV